MINSDYSFYVSEAATCVANFTLNTYDITAKASPEDGGTITRTDRYGYGTTATLTATPNEGYEFVNWTEDGVVVSTDATYSFTVSNNRMLVANFDIVGVTNTFTLSGWNWWSANQDITLNKGINWIGYPCQETMAIKDALAGLNAASGDRIKSEGKTATFLGSSWTGTLKNLEPNHGYIYTAKAAASSFTYPTGAKTTQFDVEEPTFWTPERTRFASNMNVLAVLNLDGMDQTSPDIEIGAFVNGECRDAVRLIHFEETGQDLALFTISGENGETIHFKALVNGNVIDLVETVTVQLDGMVGDFDRPFVLHNAADLDLFPNPAGKEERVSVKLPYWIELAGARIEVYNALGALVATETVNGNHTELEGFKVTGLYTVKVTDRQGNTCYGKLVVK